MKNKVRILISILLVCVCLSGCSSLGFDNSDLMRPPRATGDRAQIQKVIDSCAGGSYTFKYPQGGEYRSAVIMHDITGDGEEEAVAIYRTSDQDAQTHVILIDEIDGKWTLSGDFQNAAPEVSQIVFADLDGDGADEILVGFCPYSSILSSLAMYTYNGVNAQSVTLDETFTDLAIGDFTGSGQNELVLLSRFSNETAASARLMYFSRDKNTLSLQSAVEMDSTVSRFISINFCKIARDTFGLAVDGQSVDDNYYTQLIYFDPISSQLQNSLYSAQNENKSMHRRDYSVCRDIDGDSVAEVPVTQKMPFDTVNEAADLVASEITYSEYMLPDGRFEEECRFIADPSNGYLFKIPNEMYGKITARIDSSAGTLTIYTVNKSSSAVPTPDVKGQMILTLRVFTPEQWTLNAQSSGYTAVMELNDSILAYAAADNTGYDLSTAQIRESIVPTEPIKN